jgi:hypothetical protein
MLYICEFKRVVMFHFLELYLNKKTGKLQATQWIPVARKMVL